MQSNFDLQLRGTLPHGIEVTGALSDNSIPIQPEGNSLRLQEFDKVFIRLKKDQATLIAGDHGIRNPDNYFIRRSEEHTSELQSRGHLVCRLLLEKKNT